MTDGSEPESILLVDDDASFRGILAEVLSGHEYRVTASPDAYHALEVLQSEPVDLVVTDLDMPGLKGDALLAQIRSTFPEVPVIAITAFGSVESALELTRAGAADYLAKPFRVQPFLDAVRRVLDQTRSAREAARMRRRHGRHLEGIVAASGPMRRLFERVARVATSPAPVLITGETGTGKDLIARAVHHASGRGALVTVNSGAIPEHLMESELFGHVKGAFTGADHDRSGLFQAADGGTLFLDEIGELPLALQPKLLRAIETGEVRRVGGVASELLDVRIIAATHRELGRAVQEGTFREDLYWRINVLHLEVPPLRERPGDIPLLVDHVLSRARQRGALDVRVSAPALSALVKYSWPGNVRQLRGVLERASTFCEGAEVCVDDLPPELRRAGETVEHVRSAAERELTLAELEREYVLEVLRRTGGQKSRAADWLGIPRRTLYRRLEEYGKVPEV
ncbi:MAG: sigma-54 dependent transcriptional regulator [Gemmatimonadetes bacterium]|nr:sigma-54 dependent transcriptional regulator [Gemmatimonadota bacterium]